jgi:hypothetical protein
MMSKGLKFHECEENVDKGLLQVPDQGRRVLLEAVDKGSFTHRRSGASGNMLIMR